MAGETPPVPRAPEETPGAGDEAAAGGATPRPVAKVVVRASSEWAVQGLVEEFCTVAEGFNIEVERLVQGCRLRGRGGLAAEVKRLGRDAVVYLYDWDYKEVVFTVLRLATHGKRVYAVAISL